MKLLVIIPAFNEEKTIAEVMGGVPKEINNVNKIEIIIIDDGSTDQTKQLALEAGAKKVISNGSNKGLAYTYKRSLEVALEEGADIVINIDADGQHNPGEIESLVRPILEKKADMVVGDRQINKNMLMKSGNKHGNLFGDWIIRKLTRSNIRDASSGFRALSREALLRLNIHFNYTYTHETIIQAVFKNLTIINVPITVSERKEGESKLIKSLYLHIRQSGIVIVRTIMMYRPLKTLLYLGVIIMIPGILLGLRVSFLYFTGQSTGGRLHSLILTAILIIVGSLVVALGFLGDLISHNRKIEEEILYNLKKEKYNNDESAK